MDTILLVLVAAASHAVSLSHPMSHTEFPSALDGWVASAGTATTYDAAGSDVSLSYFDKEGGCITVYVYPQNQRSLDDEFEGVSAGMMKIHRDVRPLRTSRLTSTPGGFELWLDAKRTAPFGNETRLSTSVSLFAVNGWFIKMRASFPIAHKDTDGAVHAFISAWRWPR